jgi:hypothetical protein
MSIKNQGMNWIRPPKRLAIYLRDGLACAYCGDSVEAGAALTLDHVRPTVHGGTNNERNLVTACQRCNLSKNSRSLLTFARAVAGYINHDVTAEQIVAHVKDCSGRALDIKLAQSLIAERGSASKALSALRGRNREAL